MKNKIIFASNNAGKITELQSLLKPFHYEIIPQSLLGIPEIEETGLTFVENAILKARHACQLSEKPAIADDSGLVVQALHGPPGIYSARYAGKKADAAANNKKLLTEMADVPKEERQAHFHCALVYLQHAEDPAPLICEGIWNGFILNDPIGIHGFGYDPLFYDINEMCSAAEFPLEKKNKISHRAHALRALMTKLNATQNG